MQSSTITKEELQRAGEILGLSFVETTEECTRALTEEWLEKGNALIDLMSREEFAGVAPACRIHFKA